MYLPQAEKIEVSYLNRLFDKTSESYKFFWFQAILNRVVRQETEISFDDLVNDMLLDAWYMVTEYHLNLGPSDAIERCILYLQSMTHLRPNEKKEIIRIHLENTQDSLFKEYKRALILNVPYRLQAPFLSYTTKDWNVGTKALAEKINQKAEQLIYTFSKSNGMQTTILLNPNWCTYMIKHQEILQGWLNYNLILYLQKRNPAVPGISDKLSPPTERKLTKVIHFWKNLNAIQPIQEIYGNTLLTDKDLSIDHFVPWSFVANDEFWNLHPTTKRINSSKSNHLPDWNHYFTSLSNLEYAAYQAIWKNDEIHTQFEHLAKDHLNNLDVKERIYHCGQTREEFQSSLESVLKPVYQSAENCGFTNWIYTKEGN